MLQPALAVYLPLVITHPRLHLRLVGSLLRCRSPDQSLFFTRLTQLIAALVILAPLESCSVLLHFSLTSVFQTTTTTA
jgi:hypothetical protein